jgi:hypothetical protein
LLGIYFHIPTIIAAPTGIEIEAIAIASGSDRTKSAVITYVLLNTLFIKPLNKNIDYTPWM